MGTHNRITEIRKRDGSLAVFQLAKIANAISKALAATNSGDGQVVLELATQVVSALEDRFAGRVVGVEDVQDVVEQVLMKQGFSAAAKAYILYRQRRAEVREAKRVIGVQDELKLSVNAVKVLERRYLLRDEDGRIVETPLGMFKRVARAVAAAESLFDPNADVPRWEEDFFSLMTRLDFLPNSPTLMNAGTPLGQLSACFVLPVDDSLEGIFDTLKHMALIHQSGGGTGFSFSRIRPKGDRVRSTMGIASGPVSFMTVFDAATNTVKQGGKRRGANMGILSVHHPDILEFITAKDRDGFLSNFNISVALTDEFMSALAESESYPLVNPRNGQEVRRLRAQDVFELMVTSAWRTGDPGAIFIDVINRGNPTPALGMIEATNPCGELPLLPYESCNLGSVNLAHMVSDGEIDWKRLRETVHLGVRFLDDVIQVNRFPLQAVKEVTWGNRKIGLGVMGFADALIELGIPYDSEEGVDVAERLMQFISQEARIASNALAQERGPFPNYSKSIHAGATGSPVRNASVISIAPTGTISLIAGCSSGIEPLFALAFVRNVMEGTRLLEVNPLFDELARRQGFYSADLMAQVARKGTVRGVPEAPAEVQRLFVTDFDIAPEWHVRMQAAFQKHTDNAVSKTINLPEEAPVEAVRQAYLMAYRLGCKGITVYRYGSKRQQVLYRGGTIAQESGEIVPFVSADSEYAGGCPEPACHF